MEDLLTDLYYELNTVIREAIKQRRSASLDECGGVDRRDNEYAAADKRLVELVIIRTYLEKIMEM